MKKIILLSILLFLLLFVDNMNISNSLDIFLEILEGVDLITIGGFMTILFKKKEKE